MEVVVAVLVAKVVLGAMVVAMVMIMVVVWAMMVVVTMVVVLVNLVVVEARRRRPGGSCGLSCYRSLLARSPPQTKDLLFL